MTNVLYKDNHILVVYKEQNTLQEKLLEEVKKELEKDGQKTSFMEPINVLSVEAGGIVVVALSSKAKERLLKQADDGEFSLKHFAVCVGKPKFSARFIFSEDEEKNFQYLHRNSKTKLLEFIPSLNQDAQKVYDPYKVLEDKDKISLVEIFGGFKFFDEVRFLLKDAGSPVFGDKKYGGDTLAKNTNLALFLVEAKFCHPTTNKNMSFCVFPPIDKKPWSYFNVEKFLRIWILITHFIDFMGDF